MGKNQVLTHTPKTTPNKIPKSHGNITKSKTTITNNNKNRSKPPTSNSSINGVKDENHNEEQVKPVSKKIKPSIIKNEEKNRKKKVKENDGKVDDSKNENPLYNFPMNRISRIIKAESDARINQEAIFLINKASEKFIQLFSTEAFADSLLDKKKQISYQHLSSVVCKRKRLDFLSDYVPEKVKVEDALKEMPSVET